MKYSDVIIHLNDETNDDEKESLLNQLKNQEGVITPKFSEKEHLLLVSYNSDTINSLALLNKVKEQGFEAQLVGL